MYAGKNYQLFTIVMTKDKYRGRYRLGLNSLFVPESFLLKFIYSSNYTKVTKQDLINLGEFAEQQIKIKSS